MAKRRRPAIERGPAPSGDAMDATAAEAATVVSQLALPLSADVNPSTETPPMASARALPSLSAAYATALPDEAHPVTAPRPARPSQPRAGRANVRACFDELRTALEEGWEIVQPIFARPLWSVSDNSTTAFNFVLRRERATRLVTVPEGRGVQRFIRDHHLTVDYRR